MWLNARVGSISKMLLSIGHGFSSYPDPKQASWGDAGAEALEQFKELKVVFWVPVVRASSDAVFRTGGSESFVGGLDVCNRPVVWVSGPVFESFPIVYRTGAGLPQWKLGMDLATMPKLSVLLEQSRESRGPVLETLNAAEKNPRNARQLVLIVPIFGHGSNAEECQGFVVGMLKFQRQVNSAYASPRLPRFDKLVGDALPGERRNPVGLRVQPERGALSGILSKPRSPRTSFLYGGFFFTGLATLGAFALGRTATLAKEQTKAHSERLSETLLRLECQAARLHNAETALERQKALLNSMPAFILARDADRRVLKANQKAARSIGKSVETIEGRTMAELGITCREDSTQGERTPNRSRGSVLGKIGVPQAPAGETVWMRAEEISREEAEGSKNLIRETGQKKAAQEALRRRNRELLILTRIGSSLGTAMQSEQVASHVQMHMVYLLRAAAGVITTVHPSVEEELVLSCSWGVEHAELEGFLSRLKQERLPREPMEDSACYFLRKAGMKVRRLRIPIVSRGKVRGVIDLWGAKSDLDDEFSLQFFRTLGIVVGSALERARLFEQVQGGRKQLADLSLQIMKIQEEERRHIGRELHDEVGQLLSALKLSLQMQNSMPEGSSALQIVNELLHRVRQMSLDLRPAMLEDLGLVAAVSWLTDRFRMPGGPVIELQESGVADRRFPPKLEIVAFRIVQEAVTNAIRHSRAGRITIRMWADATHLGVQVEDDGVGFDPEVALQLGRSGGLSGMRERINLLGGELTMESKAGGGTRMCGELPFPPSMDPQREKQV